MADIWSNVSANVQPRDDAWLYRQGTEVHGPVPQQVIADKLRRGELNLKTWVGREGGDFHPIVEVAAFAEFLEDASKAAKKKAARRNRLILLGAGVLMLAAAGGVSYYLKLEADNAAALQREKLAQEEQARQKKQAELDEFLKAHSKVELVALVSLGDLKDVKVGSQPSKRRTSSSKSSASRSGSGGAAKEPEFVSQCQRTPQQIYSVLGRHIRTINICVQDEKQRDKQGLLPETLVLDFVATPSGKVVDFQIADRHYRTGPMKNCMVKAFRLIKFPPVGGSNCPSSIPIKIKG